MVDAVERHDPSSATVGLRRYPGVRAFADSDVDRLLFFGRDREARDLRDLILAEPFVVVYARSGTGKTSLINAGVKDSLRRLNYAPLSARFNGVGTPWLSACDSLTADAGRQGIEIGGDSGGSSPQEFFGGAEFWRSNTLLTPILIIDQFEELFTLHAAMARHRFITDLGLMARAIRKGRESGSAAKRVTLKIVISVREDFLPSLEELSDEIPTVLNTRFRLVPFDRLAAKRAIEEPAKAPGIQSTPAFGFSEGTVSQILDYLSRSTSKGIETTGRIEPFQLQLVCQQIEEQVRRQNRPLDLEMSLIDFEKDLGGQSGLRATIRDFYERQLKDVGAMYHRRSLDALCERGLVNSQGRRISLEESEIKHRFKVPPAALAQLAARRILNTESRIGSTYYELSHDTLIDPVLDQRERRGKKWRRRAVGAALGVLLAIGGTVAWEWRADARREAALGTLQRARDDPRMLGEASLIAVLNATARSMNSGALNPSASRAIMQLLVKPTPVEAVRFDGTSSALSADGRLVAVGRSDGRVHLLDASGTMHADVVAGTGAVSAVAFNDAGDLIAAASSFGIGVWDTSGKQQSHFVRSGESVLSLALSHDGSFLVAGSRDGAVELFDKTGRAQTISQGGGTGVSPITRVAVSNEGDRLLALSSEGILHWWRRDGQTFRLARDLALVGPRLSWTASPNGKHLATVMGSKTVVWDTSAWLPVATIKTSSRAEADGTMRGEIPPAFSDDGARLAIVDRSGDLTVFDAGTGGRLQQCQSIAPQAVALAWSPDNEKVVVATDKAIGVCHVSSRASTLRDSTEATVPVNPMPTAKLVAVNELVVPIKTLAFVGSGRLLVGGADNDIRILDIDSRGQLKEAGTIARGFAPVSYVQSIVVVRSNKRIKIAVLDDEDRFEVWDITDEHRLITAERGRGYAALIPGGDGRSVLISTKATVKKLDLSGAPTTIVELPLAHKSTTDSDSDRFTGLRLPATPRRLTEPTKPFATPKQIFVVDDYGVVRALLRSGPGEINTQLSKSKITAIGADPRLQQVFVGTEDGGLQGITAASDDIGSFGSRTPGHSGPVNAITSTNNGRWLISGSSDGVVKLSAVTTSVGDTLNELVIPRIQLDAGDVINDLAVSTNAILIATNKRLIVSRLFLPSRTNDWNHDVVAVASHTRMVVTFDKDEHRVSVFDSSLSEALSVRRSSSAGCVPQAFAIAPDGRAVVVGCDKDRIAILSPTGSFVGPLLPVSAQPGDPRGNNATVTSVAYAEAGKTIVASTDMGHVVAIPVGVSGKRRDWKLQGAPTRITALAISRNDRVAAVTDHGEIYVWPLADSVGSVVPVFQPHPRHKAGMSIAWSPDGKLIIAGYADGTIRGFDLGTGRASFAPVEFAPNNDSAVVSIAVSPDGSRFVASDDSGGIGILSSSGEFLADRFNVASDSTTATFVPDGDHIVLSRASLVGPMIPASTPALLKEVCARLQHSRLLRDNSNHDALEICYAKAWGKGFDAAVETNDLGAASPKDYRWKMLFGWHATTLLQRAIVNHADAVIPLLLHNKADIEMPDSSGRTALTIALRQGDPYVIRKIVESSDIKNRKTQTGESYLHDAAVGGSVSAVRRLLEAGATVDERDEDGVTPLMIAALYGNTDVLKILLDANATIDMADKFGHTALMWAASAGERSAVELLIDRRANINVRSTWSSVGYSPAQIARAFSRDNVTAVFAAHSPPEPVSTPRAMYRIDVGVFKKASLRAFVEAMLVVQQKRQLGADAEQKLRAIERLSAADPDAECLLGIADLIGYGQPVNLQEARKHFASAAARDSALGHSLYALMLTEGIGGVQDVANALAHLRVADAAREPYGAWLLGMAYTYGVGVERSKDRADALFRRAVEDGARCASSSIVLGLNNSESDSGNSGVELARTLDVARQAGDVLAINNAGVWYFNRRDFSAALRTFNEATTIQSKQLKLFDPVAERGYALLNLGLMAKFGFGRQMDRAVSIDLLRRGAAAKHAWAAREVAFECNVAPAVCTKSEETTLLRQAAANGDSYAITKLKIRRIAPSVP